MAMREVFKLTLIFLFVWIGIKSLLDITKDDISSFSLVVDILLFITFIGSPAATYWANKIDNIFKTTEKDNVEENND